MMFQRLWFVGKTRQSIRRRNSHKPGFHLLKDGCEIVNGGYQTPKTFGGWKDLRWATNKKYLLPKFIEFEQPCRARNDFGVRIPECSIHPEQVGPSGRNRVCGGISFIYRAQVEKWISLICPSYRHHNSQLAGLIRPLPTDAKGRQSSDVRGGHRVTGDSSKPMIDSVLSFRRGSVR